MAVPSSAASRRQATARPRPGRPARAERPDALRVLAARGGRGRVRARPGRHPACAGPVVAVEEDPWASRRPPTGSRRPVPTGCSSPARWAASPPPTREPPVARADLLRRRVARVEHRGGWPTLGRTSAADLADSLWSHREHFLQQYEALPLIAHHGDPAAANLRGREGDLVLAIDWRPRGRAGRHRPGLHMASAREAPEPLLDAYLIGLAGPRPPPSPPRTRCASGRASSTPPSAERSGPSPGWRPARERSPRSSATPAWRRTCATSSGWQRSTPSPDPRRPVDLASDGLSRAVMRGASTRAGRDSRTAGRDSMHTGRNSTQRSFDRRDREGVARLHGALAESGLEPRASGTQRSRGSTPPR